MTLLVLQNRRILFLLMAFGRIPLERRINMPTRLGMPKAEILERICETMEQQAAIFLDISGTFTFKETSNVKARLDEEISHLQALCDEVNILYLQEFTAKGQAN